jgi:hypothetical protein
MTPHETDAPLAPEVPPAKLIRIPLRDLPTTPEIEQFAEESYRFFGRRRAGDRAYYLDQAKLQFYFNGMAVAYLTGEPEGKVVIHVYDPRGGEPVTCVTAALTPEQRRRVCFDSYSGTDATGALIPPLYNVRGNRTDEQDGARPAGPDARGHDLDAHPLR